MDYGAISRRDTMQVWDAVRLTQKATPVLLMELGPAPTYEALRAQLDRCFEDMARIRDRDLDSFLHEPNTRRQHRNLLSTRLLSTTASRSAAIRETGGAKILPTPVRKAAPPATSIKKEEAPETERPGRPSPRQATPSPHGAPTPFSARRTPRRALNPFPQLSPFLTETQRKKAASPLPKPNYSKYRRKKTASARKRKTPRALDSKTEIEQFDPTKNIPGHTAKIFSHSGLDSTNDLHQSHRSQRTVSKSNAFAEIINKSCFNN